MTKLVDQFGTQYFASHYAGEVKSFLSTVKQVDLAGARICRDVMKHITSAAYEGVEVHDTEDPEREEYFEENRRRMELKKNCPASVPLILPSSIEDVVNAINSLNPDRLYHMANGRADADRAFAFLVQAARPEIKIDLQSSVGELFKLIADNLYPNSHHWNEFYVLVGFTFTVQRPVPGEYNLFLSDNLAIPTVFGKENLFKLPEWRHCIDRVAKVLEKSMKPKNRKIKDFL